MAEFDVGEIIRWGVVFAFAWAFFLAMYLTILPDPRLLYLPVIGFGFIVPFVLFLYRYYKVSAFEPMEVKAKKKQLFQLIGLAVSSFLIFDFMYLTMPEFQFAANFYVGLALFFMIYIAIAYAGGPALSLYRNVEQEVIIGTALAVAVGGFSVISMILGVIVFPLATVVIPVHIYVFLILLWAILGAITEELAFRGALAPLIASRAGIAISSAIVSITFMLYHYLAYGVDPVALAYLFVMSMLLTLAALYTRSLLPALIAHILNNVLATLTLIHPLLGLAALGALLTPFFKIERIELR